MRNAVNYLLILVFLYNILGFYPVFLLKQSMVRAEIKNSIKNSLSNEQMKKFILSEKEYEELAWVRYGKEFELNGYFYDIVRVTSGKAGDLTLQCINDKQEEILFAGLDKQVEKNSAKGKQAAQNYKITAIPFYTGTFAFFPGIKRIINTIPRIFLNDGFPPVHQQPPVIIS